MSQQPDSQFQVGVADPVTNTVADGTTGSVVEGYDWSRPVGVWGPADGAQPTPRTQTRIRRTWGIPDAVVMLLLAVFGSVPLVVVWAVIDLAPRVQDGQEIDAATVEAVLTSLTTNPVFLLSSLVLLWAAFVGVPLYSTYRRGQRSLAADFGWAAVWRVDLPLGIAVGLGLRVLDVAASAVAQALGLNPEEMSNAGILSSTTNPVLLGLIVAAAAFVAPVTEELAFRGLVLRAFAKKWGTVAGVVISSVLFGLLHTQSFTGGGAYIVVVTGLLGAILAVLAVRTRRLAASASAHVVFNLTGVVLAFAFGG